MSAFAAATGIGSWPGASAREAAAIVVGELHTLPHLVELPGRGVGADMIGRAAALLIDISMDTVPRGYRIASGRTAVVRRALSLLDEDLDAFEEAWEKAGLRGAGRTVKVQAPGPITLAAQLELTNGHRAITDAGAVRDLTTSLAEGMATHRAHVGRRLDAAVVVQFDEPLLPEALAGRLTGVTGLTPVHAIDEPVAIEVLNECAAAVSSPVVAHSCAAGVPWKVLQRSNIDAVSVDVSALAPADLDGIGDFVDSGRTVLFGVVPSTAPDARPSVEEIAKAAVSLTDRLGFARSVLRERVGITPACGLAGATAEWARAALGLAQKTADAFAENPDAI